jgi:alanine dehydrogenase
VRIGVPAELKDHEDRVALTPAGADELVRRGHTVLIEQDAGRGSSILDHEYQAAGAHILTDADKVWADSQLILKVKEPVIAEFSCLQPHQVLFTYLHLAAATDCASALVNRMVTAIAYETVEGPGGSLPLLAPMSEVAGRMAPQVGAACLQRAAGGRGVLLGGVPGVSPASVVVIGAGIAGFNAASVASGMGADVTLLDLNLDRLRRVDTLFGGRVRTLASTAHAIAGAVCDADLVIGAVLVPGARAPQLVDNDLVARMRPGSVLVDVAIDQGGCFADSRPTTHSTPTYIVHRSVFYCVANMPGAVPHTSTFALTNATLPYVVSLADRGWLTACREDPGLARGVNAHAGALTNAATAEAQDLPTVPIEEVLNCAESD